MLRHYFLLILAVSLFLGCVAIGVYDEDAIEKCGGKKYTSVSQICENNVLKTPCGNNFYVPSTQFCYENNVIDKCQGNNYNPANQKCESGIVKTQCGTGGNYHDPLIQFCNENDVIDKCGGKNYDPLTEFCINDYTYTKCGGYMFDPSTQACFDEIAMSNKSGIFTDRRDDKTYRYVGIGDQIWMAENLRYETENTKCYDNDPNNCEIFGILYNKSTAETICPSGWHLPNDNEWIALADFVESSSGCSDCAGAKLKANSELWVSGNGTDDFGFAALPDGYYYDRSFRQKGERASFWTTYSIDRNSNILCFSSSYYACFRNFSSTNESLNLGSFSSSYGSHQVHVRCIKD